MKSINDLNAGCDPISSNCVTWQGPDLGCISLCTGDTISSVTYKLAVNLCELMDQFKIESYDLECLNLGKCEPDDFKQLIQILIDRICELSEHHISSGDGNFSNAAEVVVPINPAFYYVNEKGDTVTTMKVSDYVVTVANKLVNTITSVSTNQSAISDLSDRVVELESSQSSPGYTLPFINPVGILEKPTSLEVFTAELEKQFVEHRKYVGSEQDLLKAIQSQTPGLNQSDQLHGDSKMANIEGWVSTPSSLANTVSNLWRTTTDLRNALNYVLINGVTSGVDSINLKVSAKPLSADQIQLDFSGVVPNNFVDSDNGTSVELYDSTGAGPQLISNISLKRLYLDTGEPLILNLNGLSGLNDITVKVKYRFIDEIKQSTISDSITTTALGLNSCPGVSYVAGTNFMNYSFQWTGQGSQVLTMQLWDKFKQQLLQSSSVIITNGLGSGSFSGLTSDTVYNLKLVINDKSCTYQEASTLVQSCAAPVVGVITVDYTNIKGATTCSNISF